MIDLAQRSEPSDIHLLQPNCHREAADHGGIAAAQPAAQRVAEAIGRQARERAEAGLPLDGLPDLSVEGERDGFYEVS